MTTLPSSFGAATSAKRAAIRFPRCRHHPPLPGPCSVLECSRETQAQNCLQQQHTGTSEQKPDRTGRKKHTCKEGKESSGDTREDEWKPLRTKGHTPHTTHTSHTIHTIHTIHYIHTTHLSVFTLWSYMPYTKHTTHALYALHHTHLTYLIPYTHYIPHYSHMLWSCMPSTTHTDTLYT